MNNSRTQSPRAAYEKNQQQPTCVKLSTPRGCTMCITYHPGIPPAAPHSASAVLPCPHSPIRMSSLLSHKKINLDYEVLEKMEAGLELHGYEVKSLRAKLGSLEGAYVTVRDGEAFVLNMYVPAYQEKNTPTTYDTRRQRRLLLTRAELLILEGLERQKGLTIVPVMVYNKGRKVKVEIAVVRGKKKYDKRHDMKRRDSDREIARTLKTR